MKNMNNKYIHYCWFGDKPLPKLAKKCIKSWKKYLPDYEIIKWSEENVDLEECAFIKEAYKKKKWAFIADYARTKALYEYGGIYFDTDMLVKSNIDFLLDKETFLGIEDSNMVNAAVWGEKNPHALLPKELLKFYKAQTGFNENDMYSFSIPRLITKILNKYNFNHISKEIQILNESIYIYPRDYFYPLSYNYRNNLFTKRTCMIHYFDATWVPKWEQRENKLIRKFGEENAKRIIKTVRYGKRIIKKTAKTILFPVVLYRRYKKKYPDKYFDIIKNAENIIKNYKDADYIVLHNPDWFGVTNATIELFDNRLPLGELKRKKDVKLIGDLILSNNIKQVIFSAMCVGWKDLAIYLKLRDPKIKIKTFWHGNHSQVSEPYGWDRNKEIFKLSEDGIIDVMGTCKKSLIKFYETRGYKSFFITNKVSISTKLKSPKYNDGRIHIGLYAAKSDDWRKNMFTQIAAASLIKNAVLDIVPLNSDAKKFASDLKLEITGIEKSIPREELITRMSKNDINLYATFSECSPMIILESFAMGVPCIAGNNHHYFENSKLKEYLMVNNEASPRDIAKHVNKCLKEKDYVLKEYEKWEKTNTRECISNVKKFLEM